MPNWIWDTMHVAVAAVLVLGAVLAVGIGYTFTHRLLSSWADRRRMRRRSRYLAQSELLAAGELSPAAFVRAVARRDYVPMEEQLLEIAGKFTGEVRSLLAEAFAGLGAVERNRRRLAHRLWWVRADSARRLGLMGAAQAAPWLRPLLKDPNVEVRIAAARSLLALGDADSLADLVPTLDRETPFSKLRLADVIMEAGQNAVPALIQYVATARQPQGAAIAIDILGDMRALQGEPVIRLLLASSDSIEIRAAACRALGRFESPDAVDVLSSYLHDSSWIVRAQAVRSLGQVGDPAAVPLIRHLLLADEPWLVYNTAVALWRMGTPGEQALRDVLAKPDLGDRLVGQVAREIIGTQPERR